MSNRKYIASMLLLHMVKVICVILLLFFSVPLSENIFPTFLSHTKSDLEPAVVALLQLIDEFYAPNTESLAISVYGTDHCARWNMRRFLNQLLSNINGLKVTIEKWRAIRLQLFADRKFNLILVDSVEALQLMHPARLTHDYDINEHYFVYLVPPCGANSEVFNVTQVTLELFKYFWKHYIINVSLILDGLNETCTLHTFFPFTSNTRCRLATVRRINRFAAGSWLRSDVNAVFPPKLKNLHLCPLKVAVWDTPPYLSLYPIRSGFWRVGDFEGTMLLELAKKMNFTIDYVIPPNDEQRGKRLSNGITTGAMQLLQQRHADLSLGSFRYTLERCQILTGALPYYQTWQIYGILLGAQPYTSLEILTFAFDNRTWLCLCLSLQIVGLLSFLLYRHQSTSNFAHIILGQPVPQMPLTNVFASFFGYPTVRLPWNTFTRFVLTLWLIYGVLLRIAYQSLLFKLLQTKLYREPPHNLVELIEAGYMLVMTAGTRDSIYTAARNESGLVGIVINTNSSELETFTYVETAAERQLLAGIAPMDFLTYYVMKYNKRGIFYILPEKIFTQHITMYFTKHSYLIERFNQLFMNLRSQGMIDYWARQSLDTSYFWQQKTVEVNGITFQRISGVFVIYLVLLGVAFGILCLEIAWHRCRH